MIRTLTRPALIALLVGALAAPALQAQSAEAVLQRYTKAIDPQGKIPKIEGMKSTITMEIPAAGMSANVTAVQARPNLIFILVDIPGLGQQRQGYDGTTAWSSDPMGGPRIVTGTEAATIVDGANLNAMMRLPELFSATEVLGDEQIAGEAATCLKLTWKSSRVTTECYSKSSGLLLETRTKQSSQMGEIDVVANLSDYRDIDGIKVPHKMTQSLMGMQQTMTTTSVSFGKQDPKAFELPPEIKALKDR